MTDRTDSQDQGELPCGLQNVVAFENLKEPSHGRITARGNEKMAPTTRSNQQDLDKIHRDGEWVCEAEPGWDLARGGRKGLGASVLSLSGTAFRRGSEFCFYT